MDIASGRDNWRQDRERESEGGKEGERDREVDDRGSELSRPRAVVPPRALRRRCRHTECAPTDSARSLPAVPCVRCRWVPTLCVYTAAAVRAGNHGVAWKARCLCRLPPGPSPPPCLPRSPSPCPVASCLARWRCPWPSSRAKSTNMRLLHPRAALSSHSGARGVARSQARAHP